MPSLTPEQIREDVAEAEIPDIDPRQSEISRRLTMPEKGRLLADLIDSARKMAFVSERALNPDLSKKEIHRRAIARFMRFSEWDADLLARFKIHLEGTLNKLYPDED